MPEVVFVVYHKRAISLEKHSISVYSSILSIFTSLKTKSIYLTFAILLLSGNFVFAEIANEKEGDLNSGVELNAENEQSMSSTERQVVTDTTELNSLSKFNFVFYYIYKLKYSEDPETNQNSDYIF